MLAPIFIGVVHHASAQTFFSHICGMGQTTGDTQKSPLQKTPSCPICQGLNLLGNASPPPVDAVTFVAQSYAGETPFFTHNIVLVPTILSPQAQPRAPPLLV